MKINDTIGILLGCRPDRMVLSIDPEQSVYEALEMLAKYNIGVFSWYARTAAWLASSRNGITRAKASWGGILRAKRPSGS